MKLKNIAYVAFIAATAAAVVIGSAGPSQAKHKKKMAAAAPTPVFCGLEASKPVCGTRGGMKFTYADACYATKDGAKVTSWKACPTKAMKAHKMSAKKAKSAKK
jgi:hypothetical protein